MMNGIQINRKGFGELNMIDNRDRQELERVLCSMAGLVKQTTGTTNFIAYYTMMDAMDHVRKHPAFKREVKMAFNIAKKKYNDYEKSLRFSNRPRFFCVEDIPEHVREKYKKGMTDTEYWNMWCDVGASSYASYSKELKVLYWKYHKSLNGHGVKHADILAWVLLADAALMLSVKYYDYLIKTVSEHCRLSYEQVDRCFSLFSLEGVEDAWDAAITEMQKHVNTNFNLSPSEDRNIYLGLRQLEEAISDDIMRYGGLREAIDMNKGVFASKWDYRQAVNEINRLSETEPDL